MAELGVFCGTFNPIHWGHLLMAERAREQYKLSKVLLITSASPPHRNTDLLDPEARHRMVEAAAGENPYFEASRIELDREGPSYTVETLRQIRGLYPQHHLNLIIGEDNLAALHQWHQAQELFGLCRFLVAPRDKAIDGGSMDKLPAEIDVAMIDLPHIPVSSSDIRQRLRQGKSVLYLVPAVVNSLLQQQEHYVKA